MAVLNLYKNTLPPDKFGEPESTLHLIAPLTKATSPVIRRTVNGDWSLSFDYPIGGVVPVEITPDQIVEADGQPFRVQSVQRIGEGGKTFFRVEAPHVFFDLKDSTIENIETSETTPGGIPASEALTQVLHGTPFTKGIVDTTVVLDYLDVLQQDRMSVIKDQVLALWGGEIDPDKWVVNLRKEIPPKHTAAMAFPMYEGRNIKGLNHSETLDGVITRLHVIGHNKANFETINNGKDYIDSPHINDYSHIREGYVTFADDDLPEDLMAKALEYLPTVDKPRINIQVDIQSMKEDERWPEFRELETIGFAERVRLNHSALKAPVELRVLSIEYNPVTGKNLSIQLGNDLSNIYTSIANAYQAAEIIRMVTERGRHIKAESLRGTLDLLRTYLYASASYNNAEVIEGKGLLMENNNESSVGYGAMYIGPGIFALADSKENGSWVWRSAGTPAGFYGSEIVAGSITANKLSSDVGENLDISSNETITLIAQSIESRATVQQLNDLGQVVSDQSTLITQQGNLISQQATALTSLDDAVQQHDSAITQIPQEIDMRVQSITIGVKNLVRHSGKQFTKIGSIINTYELSEEWEPGQEYIFVGKGNVASGQRLQLRVGSGGSTVIVGEPDYVVSSRLWAIKFEVPEFPSSFEKPRNELALLSLPANSSTESNIEWVMVCKGNKAPLSWQAAPEDGSNIGRNLLKDSNKFVPGVQTQLSASVSASGELIVECTGSAHAQLSGFFENQFNQEEVSRQLSAGDPYTVSVIIRSHNCKENPVIYPGFGDDFPKLKGVISPTYSTLWYSGTYDPSAGGMFFMRFPNLVGTFNIKAFKLEYGTYPTPWTAAPEDPVVALRTSYITIQDNRIDIVSGGILNMEGVEVFIKTDLFSISSLSDNELLNLTEEGMVVNTKYIYSDNYLGNVVNSFNEPYIPWQGSIEASLANLPKYILRPTTLFIPSGNHGGINLSGFSGEPITLSIERGAVITGGVVIKNCAFVLISAYGSGNMPIIYNGDRPYCIEIDNSSVSMSNLRIMGPQRTAENNIHGVYASRSMVNLYYCVLERLSTAIYAARATVLGVMNSSGGVPGGTGYSGLENTGYGLQAMLGSHIGLNGGYPTGNKGATYRNGGTIVDNDSMPVGGGGDTPPPAPPPTSSVFNSTTYGRLRRQRTKKETQTGSGTTTEYTKTTYQSWATGLAPRQGWVWHQWSNWNGSSQGASRVRLEDDYYSAWIFDSPIKAGQTIKTAKLTITRDSVEGSSSAITFKLYKHGQSSIPTGTTSFSWLTDTGLTVSLSRGQSYTITLPASIVSELQSGAVKGFGLWGYSNSYGQMTAQARLEVTY